MGLPDEDHEAIAMMEFDLLADSGERQRIVAWVGLPLTSDDDCGRCPCGISVLGPAAIRICGEDAMQALTLALKFLHRRLSDELRNRTLYYPGTHDTVGQEDLDVMFSR